MCVFAKLYNQKTARLFSQCHSDTRYAIYRCRITEGEYSVDILTQICIKRNDGEFPSVVLLCTFTNSTLDTSSSGSVIFFICVRNPPIRRIVGRWRPLGLPIEVVTALPRKMDSEGVRAPINRNRARAKIKAAIVDQVGGHNVPATRVQLNFRFVSAPVQVARRGHTFVLAGSLQWLRAGLIGGRALIRVVIAE
jgi:hypothetical protein